MKRQKFEYDLLQFNNERVDDDGTHRYAIGEVRSVPAWALISSTAKHEFTTCNKTNSVQQPDFILCGVVELWGTDELVAR